MAHIYSIRQTQTPGEWHVERDDGDGALDWSETLSKPVFDPPEAFCGYGSSELDNTIPSLPPAG